MSDPLEIWTDSITTGLWCETCQFPSAVEVPCRTVNSDGVGTGGGITFRFCPDCAERNEANDD
jgi:hypothetical protein